ncbi:hypothetical protein [Pseudoduganella umbonata]|uniref:Uncharacterized protein n=1 Tax=Pseudoduganella umbonata TaxID=864828 RepID=A0A4P8HPE1_9BURK|nr:hypothetical protein [Pseudoduganella umbonata]MBB3221127.1 hypothetical protein [Pseudoduganella umbonata]QCP10320.1 hypothetical protein FCL38_07680 [Pseudoduganella umbonata]
MTQFLGACKRALLATLLMTPVAAHAVEWKTDTSKVARYFDNNNARSQHFFGANAGTGDFLLARSEPGEVAKRHGLDKVCVPVYVFDGISGILTKTANLSFYLINLSKIKAATVDAKERQLGEATYFKYAVTLNDGTKLDAITWKQDRVVACGNNAEGKLIQAPLEWTKFSSVSANTCDFDETKFNWKTDALVDAAKAFPYTHYPDSTSPVDLTGDALYRHGSVDIHYDHDQAALEQKFAYCIEGAKKMGDLKRSARANIAAQKAAELAADKTRQEKAQQAREEFMQQLVREAEVMRKTINIGTRTNCGQVFEIKRPMVGVQTIIGMQYIDISQLWGASANCYFRNGVYVGIER